MKEDKTVPQLRFPEFTDAWKQRELGEIAERVTRRNSSLESQTPLTISAEYGLIDQNKFFGKRIAAKDLSNYYLIQKGEFAYNKSTSNDAPWGAIKRLDCYNNGALSTLYIVFKIKDNKSCYSDFLVTYYGTSLWHKGVKEIATEGARNHGLLNVSPSDFFRTKLVIPQDFEEQRKIGAFFTQLDNTITLQQRKLNSLQKLKKGLLQKMFPKNGENIPEIRFPEFSDAWKQRELGEIAEKVTKKNSNLEISETFTNSAEQGIISQKDFFDHKVASSENIGNYYVVDKNDFVYNPRISTTAPVGPINRNRLGRAGVMSPLYTVFRAKDINQLFLEWYFKSSCWHLFMYFNGDSGARSDRFSIKDSVFFSMPIFVPSKEEQFKIGRFFDQLNETITLQQRKLESLQKLKKGLLQQMFI